MLAVLTAHLWQSTWFALAAALFTLAFRGHRAQVRYALWLAASIKFLVPPAHQRRGVLTLAGPVALGLLTAAHPPALGAQSAAPSRRRLAMFFDFGGMNSDEQALAREAAIGFVQTKLQPADVVSVMTAVNGKLTIAQDFTSDPAALESAIRNLTADTGSSDRLALIDSAAQILGPLPDEKMLVCFSIADKMSDADAVRLNPVIADLERSQTAVYQINIRSLVAPTYESGAGPRPRRVKPSPPSRT